MSWVNADNIASAARHLLSLLEKHEFVDYSQLYDGSEDTHERLCKAIGLDAEDSLASPELLMDLAVIQLQDHGVVERTDLPDLLSDEQPNYRISWTADGRHMAKTKLHFQDMEL